MPKTTGGRSSTPTWPARSTPIAGGARQGCGRRGGGNIVIIASEWGVIGWPSATAYSASKAGLIALTKSLGRELGPENIIVNAVAPGVTDTPQLQVDADDAGISLREMHEQYRTRHPVGADRPSDEIAAAVHCWRGRTWAPL